MEFKTYITKTNSSYGNYLIRTKNNKFYYFMNLKQAQNFLIDLININSEGLNNILEVL